MGSGVLAFIGEAVERLFSARVAMDDTVYAETPQEGRQKADEFQPVGCVGALVGVEKV